MTKLFLPIRLQCLLRGPCYEFILFDLASLLFFYLFILNRVLEFNVIDIIIIRTRFAEIYWYHNNKNYFYLSLLKIVSKSCFF